MIKHLFEKKKTITRIQQSVRNIVTIGEINKRTYRNEIIHTHNQDIHQSLTKTDNSHSK